ncbi:MAG: ECF-type sigma factor [Acidobacteriota bacterium]
MANDITNLLLAWNDGNKEALDRLVPLVKTELHKLASIYLADEGSAKTLQPTALINELYLRLVDRRRVTWTNRNHFFGFAATTMRRILVDHARARRSEKRGGDRVPVTLENAGLVSEPEIDVLDLERALEALAGVEPRLVRVVELRYYAGLTLKEASDVLGLGSATVVRDWRAARAFLMHHLTGQSAG